MQFRSITNLVLLFFVVAVFGFLFKYTEILKIGFFQSFTEGIQNLEKIIREAPPQTELSETEKNNLKKALENNKIIPPLYCQSTYFPFIPGANWSYQTTKGESKDIITIGIPSPENEKTFLDGHSSSREKWTNRTIVSCRENKIHLTDYNFLLIWEKDRTITTPCSNGEYSFSLPKDSDLVKGNTWLEKGCLIHNILDENYKEKELEIKETLEAKGKVLGQEDVAVPAGNFSATKIEFDLSGKQEIVGGIKTVESVINIWVAQGIGIVKIVYQEGSNNGQTGSSTTVTQELIGFQIPTDKKSRVGN